MGSDQCVGADITDGVWLSESKVSSFRGVPGSEGGDEAGAALDPGASERGARDCNRLIWCCFFTAGGEGSEG